MLQSNYAHVAQVPSPCSRDCQPLLLSPHVTATEVRTTKACAPQQENPEHQNEEGLSLITTRESPQKGNKDEPVQPKINKYIYK